MIDFDTLKEGAVVHRISDDRAFRCIGKLSRGTYSNVAYWDAISDVGQEMSRVYRDNEGQWRHTVPPGTFQIGDVVERIRNTYGMSSGKYVKGYITDMAPKINLEAKTQKVELRNPKAGEAYLFGSDYQVASQDMSVERWVVTL